jgi:ParB family chromosome partitioning protein
MTDKDKDGRIRKDSRKKRALGRGLDALLSPRSEDTADREFAGARRDERVARAIGAGALLVADSVAMIAVDDIKPNPSQARKTFDPDNLESLALSIKTQGLLQPLLVERTESGYQLVVGERRLRASKLAGLTKVPCIVRSYQERTRHAASLVENLQREDLNAIELAQGIRAMQANLGLTQREIAIELAMSRPNIANTLRLLDLPESVKALIADGALPPGTARALLTLPAESVEPVARQVVAENLTTRQTEALVRELLEAVRTPSDDQTEDGSQFDKTEQAGETRELKAISEELMRHLSTRVAIRKTKDGGRITLWFYSDDDLNRLLEMLGASENPL